MSDEALTNAAVERMIANYSALSSTQDAAQFRRELMAEDLWSTEDFQFVDRRHVVNFGTTDAAGLIEAIATFWDVANPTFEVVEVVGSRGQRLAAGLVRVRFPNDTVNEWILVLELDRTLQLMRRLVQFSVDDRDAAIAELDRMHAEIEAGDA